MFHVPEFNRVIDGFMGSDASNGNNGCFEMKSPKSSKRKLIIIASDGGEWEHVSIHGAEAGKQFTPEWDEMCWVKNAFWDEEDAVMQIHPAKANYVNIHKHTLHLWRPIVLQIPLPPMILV
jgi:hypothetical protein